MKISHKNKVKQKYKRQHNRRLGPTACLIDGSAIEVVNTTLTIVSGLVAVPHIPSSYRKLKNGIRRNVIGRFLNDSKNACKILEGGKACNASTKLIEITLKGERPLFARLCSENPAHLVDSNGTRIKLNNLSERQKKELFS
ncbi:hypothetical protein [Pseudoalteromonas umbrosa]|uniref:hypothetical protein n=1 Tax=Pseudoalteromonas umbrosa TaxID=3048489 RepID=UPI0024C2F307|nr:hypothetical protein [Pseudoalteromonas sp. B95]MDK1289770.1 hypothetical protein [Pseudoalteromonas sp. B95]